jgi:hypothetical protein
MTPPRLVELKCPQCETAQWIIACDYGMILEEDIDYPERNYQCFQCGYSQAGYTVLQKSPPAFLLKYKPPLRPADFGYWDYILKTNFPNYPDVKNRIYPDENIEPHLYDALQESAITNDALISIPLEQVRETLHVARFEDDCLFQKAKFYLAVGAIMAEHRLIETIPRIAKVAWLEVMDTIISSALPGVGLIHKTPLNVKQTSQAPPATSTPERFNFQYFLIDAQGPYWDGIKRAKNIAVRVPDEIPNPQLKIYADTSDYLKFGDPDQIPWLIRLLRKFNFSII